MANAPIKRWLKILLPLVLGFFFVWYSFKDTTENERALIWQNITQANLYWVSLSVGLGFLSHLIRANRWKLLLYPLNDSPKLHNCFFAVMFGYLANLGIPRSGEVLRGASYASYTNLSFEQSFGTIITERVIDLIMLLLIIGIALVSQTDEILYYLDVNNINPLYTFVVIIPLLVIGFVVLKLLNHSDNKLIIKLRNLLTGLYQGIKSILKLEKKWSFLFQTLAIWLLYFIMFWVIKFSIFGTENISIGASLVAFIAGAFAMSITSGGIGIYPIAIASVYNLYDVPTEIGQAFGWVIWTAQTILVLITGSISAIMLPLLNKKL